MINGFNNPKLGRAPLTEPVLRNMEETTITATHISGNGNQKSTRGSQPFQKRLRPRGQRIVFTGIAYIGGRKITDLDSDVTKPWVKITVDTATGTEENGPPPDPFPENEEWFEKAFVAGHIHMPRGV